MPLPHRSALLDASSRFPNLGGVKRGIRFVLLAAVLALALPGSAVAFGPLSSFGEAGGGPGQLNQPRGIAVGGDGTTYVAEYGGQRVSAFASDGAFLRMIGVGDLHEPAGVALGPEGNVFVSDSEDDRIVVYSTGGAFVHTFGESGEGAGQLDEPFGIEFDRSGLLYVADSSNSRIDVFTPEGDFIRALGKEVDSVGGENECIAECRVGVSDGSAGSMDAPTDVAFGPDDEMVVADGSNNRVDVFSAAGVFIRAFGKEVNAGVTGDPDICESECQIGISTPAAGSLGFPSAVAVDAGGNVYVADREHNRVGLSQIGGAFISAFGERVIDEEEPFFQICTVGTGCKAGGTGTLPGAISEPRGIALDCRGAVYVSEQGTGVTRVERFGEAGTGVPPCTEPAAAPISAPAVPVLRVSNRIRFNGLRLNRRSGTAVLFVRVPGPGRVILHGRGVRRLVRVARREHQRVRLPIRPKVRLMRYLKGHGKARIRVEVTFKPDGGIPKTIEKVVVLRRKHH